MQRVKVVLHSELRCPFCGATAIEQMPENACVFFHECKGCGVVLRPHAGDCCVFCSFGSVKCPPVQLEARCCGPSSRPSDIA